jgi:hypothetical protein
MTKHGGERLSFGHPISSEGGSGALTRISGFQAIGSSCRRSDHEKDRKLDCPELAA